jgi:hypothetical protein
MNHSKTIERKIKMKIKRFLQLGLASVLSVSSLLVLNIPAAFAAGPYTCTWTGAGSDGNFSTAANWSGCNSAAPVAGDDDQLVFPATSSNYTPDNDLSSAHFSGITIQSGSSPGYMIIGNGFILNGNIADNSTSTYQELDLNIAVQASTSVSISSNAGSRIIIGDQTALNNAQLILNNASTLALTDTTVGALVAGPSNSTINVSGTSVRLLGSGSSFTGSFGGGASHFYVDSSSFNGATANITSGNLAGTGHIGSTTIGSSASIAPGDTPGAGCLTTNALTVSGAFDTTLTGSTACSGYGQVTSASGAINLTGATLNVSLANGFTSTVGQTFTIIKNTAGSPITGTFSGLAEGSTFTAGGYTFQISYQGSDPNSVVLTVVNPSSGSGSTTSTKTAPKSPNTGLTLVAAHPLASLAATTAAAFTILVIARRLKPVKR